MSSAMLSCNFAHVHFGIDVDIRFKMSADGKVLTIEDRAYDATAHPNKNVIEALKTAADGFIKDKKIPVNDRSNLNSIPPHMDFRFDNADDTKAVAGVMIDAGEKAEYFPKPQVTEGKTKLGVPLTAALPTPRFSRDFNVPWLAGHKDALSNQGLTEADFKMLEGTESSKAIEAILEDIVYRLKTPSLGSSGIPRIVSLTVPPLSSYLAAATAWEEKPPSPEERKQKFKAKINAWVDDFDNNLVRLDALGLRGSDYERLRSAECLADVQTIKADLEDGKPAGNGNKPNGLVYADNNHVFADLLTAARGWEKELQAKQSKASKAS